MHDREMFLTVAELAELFGLSQRTAYRAVAAGDVPHVRVGGRLFIPRSAFETWLRAGQPKSGESQRAAQRHGEAGG